MFNFLDALESCIDTLNDVVYLKENPSEDAINELHALVYADNVIDCDDPENIGFYAKMFFKHYDALVWKSDLVKLVRGRVNYLISSPNA